MHRKCDINVLNPRDEYTSETIKAIRTVTSKMETLPVGTFKYKIFKYPGDIDIFESIDGCCTFNRSKIYATLEIQKIIRKIRHNSDFIFTDFKAGYDNRFKIYTGFMEAGQIVDYDPFLIRRDIDNLFKAGLLSESECCNLMNLVEDYPDINKFIALNEELRNLWLIRWSEDEILNGFKILRGNYKLFFDVALSQGSIVKLDTIAKVDDRYVEVTNFFLIKQYDRNGNVTLLSEELGDYEQSLLADVRKYYHTNTLKSIKRLWMYLNYKKKICDLSIFTELFSSSIAHKSQIISDFEVAIHLMQIDPHFYDDKVLYNQIYNRLNELKLYDFCLTLENLQQLKDYLQEEINYETMLWLKTNNIDISTYLLK